MSQHHDPVHPDSGHLTTELIADLTEGLLDEESAQHAQRHLDECALCRDVQKSLSDVTTELGSLPTPAMPDDVMARLSAALPAAAPSPADEPVAAATVVPLDAERSRRRGWAGPALGVAASVAGVLLLGALIYPSLGGSSDQGTTAASSEDNSDVGLAGAGSPAVDPNSFRASHSGTKYESADIDQQVDLLVKSNRTADTTGPVDTAQTPSPSLGDVSPSLPTGFTATEGTEGASGYAKAPMATDPAAAQACLEQYLQVTGVAPLAIDLGRFKVQDTGDWVPAAVIVLPVVNKPDLAEVYVVNADCTGGPDSVILLYTHISLN